MSNTRRIALLLVPLVGLLATGFTDCDDFDQVKVPTSDTTAPFTYDGVISHGEWAKGVFTGDAFVYPITQSDSVLAVSSALDGGGLESLTMHATIRYTCCAIIGACSSFRTIEETQSDQQIGGPGSTVSNGIYLYRGIDSDDLRRCPPGMKVGTFRFSWFTEGEDFFGNTVRGKTQVIEYQRP